MEGRPGFAGAALALYGSRLTQGSGLRAHGGSGLTAQGQAEPTLTRVVGRQLRNAGQELSMLPTPVLTWSLRIDRATVGDVHVFAAAGRLGTLSSGDLIDRLMRAIKSGARRTVVDLTVGNWWPGVGCAAGT